MGKLIDKPFHSSAALDECHHGTDHDGEGEGFEHPPFTEQFDKALCKKLKRLKKLKIGKDEGTGDNGDQ